MAHVIFPAPECSQYPQYYSNKTNNDTEKGILHAVSFLLRPTAAFDQEIACILRSKLLGEIKTILSSILLGRSSDYRPS